MRNFLSCRLWLIDLRNLIAMIVSTARLNPDFLGAAFSFITSSLYQTRSELTAIGGSTQRVVRDVKKMHKRYNGTILVCRRYIHMSLLEW